MTKPRQVQTHRNAVTIIVGTASVLLLFLLLWQIEDYRVRLDTHLHNNAPLPTTTQPPPPNPPPGLPANHLQRQKRQTQHQAIKAPNDPCLDMHGGLSLTYTYGTTASYTFLLCDIIPCGPRPAGWDPYEVYICDAVRGHLPGVQGNSYMTIGRFHERMGCGPWSNVLWLSGDKQNQYVTNRTHTLHTGNRENDGTAVLQNKGFVSRSNGRIVLTLQNVTTNPYHGWGEAWKSVTGKTTHRCGVDTDSVYFVFGVSQTYNDPWALLKVNFVHAPKPPPNMNAVSPRGTNITRAGPVTVYTTDSTGQLPAHDSIALATGYPDDNAWLNWIAATVRFQGLTDCVACASARPHLVSTPLMFNLTRDPSGSHCLLALFMTVDPNRCDLLASLFPPGLNTSLPPVFTPGEGTHSCITRTGSIDVGTVPPSWCHSVTDVTLWPNMTGPTIGRQDLFWSCEQQTLRLGLPAQWSGTCVIVRLLMPVALFALSPTNPSNLTTPRYRRSMTDHFDLSKNTPTYIDNIGIPRGVPNQFKLSDQVATGFENIPIIAALFPVTPNKNVDRINYVHYNVQRLSNLTRDAVEGLASQLAATSLMAYQNRLALDMILAEKGGVCSMFGAQCCTFIPNNTAPDGSVARALAGLRALSIQMAEDSGVENPIEKWMTDVFGKWKSLLIALLSSLACFAGILVCCGCCCIPCARTLCSRLITTALQKEEHRLPPYSRPTPLMPLMEFTTPPDQNEERNQQAPTAPDYEHSFPFPNHAPIFDWTTPQP